MTLEYCPTESMISLVHVATAYNDLSAIQGAQNQANNNEFVDKATKAALGLAADRGIKAATT